MTYISEIRGRSGKDHIDSVMKRVGPLIDATPLSEATLQTWTGTVHDILIDFWRNHGVGALQGGLMRLCVPSEFDGLLSQIFHADRDFSHKDCHVVGYGPFGNGRRSQHSGLIGQLLCGTFLTLGFPPSVTPQFLANAARYLLPRRACHQSGHSRASLQLELEPRRCHLNVSSTTNGLCCTNPMRDSLFESTVVAGFHEQLVPHEVQDTELAIV